MEGKLFLSNKFGAECRIGATTHQPKLERCSTFKNLSAKAFKIKAPQARLRNYRSKPRSFARALSLAFSPAVSLDPETRSFNQYFSVSNRLVLVFFRKASIIAILGLYAHKA
jgi:hypothetical protein